MLQPRHPRRASCPVSDPKVHLRITGTLAKFPIVGTLTIKTSGDARSLPAEALEVLRRRAVAAVEAGMSRTEVARAFGVSRKTVGAWVQAYRAAGDDALRPKPRGRRPGEQLALSPPRQAATLEAIIAGSPETHGLPTGCGTARPSPSW